jgi:hypothetical protein
MNNTNNKKNAQLYLCNNTDSDANDKCKKLIEMINVIVLEKLLTDTYKNNDIYEAVLKEQINKSKNQLIVEAMDEREYKKYKKNNIKKIETSIKDFLTTMTMNNMGQQPMDNDEEVKEGEEGEEGEEVKEGEEEVKKSLLKDITKGGNIRRKISYKKLPQSKNKQTTIHKKSKRIRKI